MKSKNIIKMIRLTNDNTKNEVRKMWKACFDDSEVFMELYFSEMYQHENTLIYFEDNQAIASLQMIPYQFTFCGMEIPISYISGACTYPEYRNHGYMGKLLMASFEEMQKRDIPLSILIPAEKWLYGYYAKYGYEKVFQKNDTEIIPLKEILDNANGDINKAYKEFDRIYRRKDFCIQKTKSDFTAIIHDAELDHFPKKTNLSGMARIIDAPYLLSLFAKRYPDKSLTFKIEDNIFNENNGLFQIEKGSAKKIATTKNNALTVNINLLTRLLFGFELENLPTEMLSYFPSHSPILNLMLE